MNIGQKSIMQMVMLATELIQDYGTKMNVAFLKSEGEGLKVSLSFDIGLSRKQVDGLDIDATISFTTEKVKDRRGTTVVEN